MRKTPLFVMCGAVLMLGVVGCNREAVDADVAATPEAADTTPGASTPAAGPAQQTTPAPAGTLTLATGAPGPYVADNTGRAVYVLEGDQNGSKCVGDCLAAWLPLLSDGASAAASPSLQGVMVGTVERSDGTTQLTYNGHPLYLYAKDAGPGTTLGHDVTDKWGEWYLVGPKGVAMDDDNGNDNGNDNDKVNDDTSNGATSAGVTAEVPPELYPVDPVEKDVPPPAD